MATPDKNAWIQARCDLAERAAIFRYIRVIPWLRGLVEARRRAEAMGRLENDLRKTW